MDNQKPDLRRLPRNVWVVTATSFLTDVSSEMIFNLVPLFLANVLKAGTAVIGLIDGLAETTASLMKIYAGALSDRLGQRKWLTVLGYAISTISKPFLYIANAWGWVLSVRMADRFGKGVRTAPRDALVADSIDEKQRGLAFGLHRAGDTAGAFLGILIAAVIVWLTERGAADLTRSTFQILVLASIVPAVLAVLVLAFGAKETGVKSRSQVPALSLKGMDTRFKLFMLVLVLFTLGNSSDAFIILLGQKRGLDVLEILLMLMTFNLLGSFRTSGSAFGQDRTAAADRRRLDRLRAGLSWFWPVARRLAGLGAVRPLRYLLRRRRRHRKGLRRRPGDAGTTRHGLRPLQRRYRADGSPGLAHRRIALAGSFWLDGVRSCSSFFLWRGAGATGGDFILGVNPGGTPLSCVWLFSLKSSSKYPLERSPALLKRGL
jgi:hypothetical protein